MKFNEKLIALRREKNSSQEKLAEFTGVSRQALAKWEQGESWPDIDKLVALSNHFQVSLDSLVKDNQRCGTDAIAHPAPAALPDLAGFLCRAKRATYAGKGAETSSSRPQSHDLRYGEPGLGYYDTYLGGEQFIGEEAAWVDEKPAWSMNYLGRVLDERFSGDFLKECLYLASPDLPFRGPLIHRNGEFTYHCSVDGHFDWFSGTEEIFWREVRVYECLFHGGAVR